MSHMPPKSSWFELLRQADDGNCWVLVQVLTANLKTIKFFESFKKVSFGSPFLLTKINKSLLNK